MVFWDFFVTRTSGELRHMQVVCLMVSCVYPSVAVLVVELEDEERDSAAYMHAELCDEAGLFMSVVGFWL